MSLDLHDMLEELKKQVEVLSIDEKVSCLNEIKLFMHSISPFKSEPVDCVQWVKLSEVRANDYNPNKVAPPEMKLLEHSIREDGYTQPIVTWIDKDSFEVIDGYHRNRVGREVNDIKSRLNGYLPVTIVNSERTEKSNRIASTIRHNRARGKHTVDGMSDIVVELKRRNWSQEKISKELGMDPDEILRLCQITGLAELFKDQEFSKSWDIENNAFDGDFDELSDDVGVYEEEESEFRTVNTSDDSRIFHKWTDWECYKAGFYKTTKDGMTRAQCETAYADFLSRPELFKSVLEKVITEWKNSCEHYLTNNSFNRIAWLGQAALSYEKNIPSCFRGGFNLLSDEQQKAANEAALEYLNRWLKSNGREEVTMEQAMGSGRQMDLY